MKHEQLEALIREAPLGALDEVNREIWKAVSEGLLTDDQAQGLAEAIHARKVTHRNAPGMATGGSVAASGHQGRAWSYFPTKKPQRSPDRAKSLERRRTLAATGPMPPSLACKFTTGELAVLRVVTDEVRDKGSCTLSIPEIAARAGVGQTKARMALRIAAGLGLLTSEERRVPYKPNLSNVVRIVSREWLAWITKHKPKGGPVTPQKAHGQRQLAVQGSLLRSPRNQTLTRKAELSGVPRRQDRDRG